MTRVVKAARQCASGRRAAAASAVERVAAATRRGYNRPVQTSRIVKGKLPTAIVAVAGAALTVGLLTGASCNKDPKAPEADPSAVIAAADSANKPPATLDRTAVPGVDVSRLPTDRQTLFFKMVGELPSPCGKAHSLRTSVTQDASCKRAPFATKLVAELVVDEAAEGDIREFYEERYVKHPEAQTFDLAKAPMVGNASASVSFVEFFDYGCPACVQLKPILDEVIAANEARIKVHYKMYPLVGKHPDSFGCAQAALAAHAQGKFHEMHDLIFKKFGAQKKDDLRKYAEEVGLDLAKYDADLAGTEPQIKADMDEGGKKGVESTPTLFIDGRQYGGPFAPKYFAMAIDEAIALKK
jgi:protein-disulfide isomerase